MADYLPVFHLVLRDDPCEPPDPGLDPRLLESLPDRGLGGVLALIYLAPGHPHEAGIAAPGPPYEKYPAVPYHGGDCYRKWTFAHEIRTLRSSATLCRPPSAPRSRRRGLTMSCSHRPVAPSRRMRLSRQQEGLPSWCSDIRT